LSNTSGKTSEGALEHQPHYLAEFVDPSLLELSSGGPVNPHISHPSACSQAHQEQPPLPPLPSLNLTPLPSPDFLPLTLENVDIPSDEDDPGLPEASHPPGASLQCDSCSQIFEKRGQLNKHKKSHTKPFECDDPSCSSRFQYRKDLNRHKSSMHPERATEAPRFYCPVKECKHSLEAGTGFPRRDNFVRHVRTKHPNVDLPI